MRETATLTFIVAHKQKTVSYMEVKTPWEEKKRITKLLTTEEDNAGPRKPRDPETLVSL